MSSTFFHGGTIWSGVNGTITDALLVVDGTVQALGETARAQAHKADAIDLDGGFLMPSFGDGHAHPLPGGLEAIGPQVRQCKSVDEIVTEVKRFAAEYPDDEWIIGASYESSMAPGGLFDARWLDAAVPDRRRVARMGLPHGVVQQRRAAAGGHHRRYRGSGARRDSAPRGRRAARHFTRVGRRRPGLQGAAGTGRRRPRRGVAHGPAQYYLAAGVTWVQDAWVEPADVDTYLAAAERNALDMRFNLGLYADPRYFDSQLEQFVDARRRVQAAASPMLTANTVKFFADGVIENETGALLAPYCGSLHQHGGQERSDPGNNRGMQVWDNLADAARAVDELGFQIHIHAIGDAAARQALDAIEYVVNTNGPRDRRPVIAHAQLALARAGRRPPSASSRCVLFGLVYIVPLTVFTTYGIVVQTSGGRSRTTATPPGN